MVMSEEMQGHESNFSKDYKVILMIKEVRDGVVFAELWGSKTAGSLSRRETGVFEHRIKYGTLKVPEEAIDCLVHHLCFDGVEISSIRNASADLATILRSIRKRFASKE